MIAIEVFFYSERSNAEKSSTCGCPVIVYFPPFRHSLIWTFKNSANFEHMCLDAFQSTQRGYVGGDDGMPSVGKYLRRGPS
jgi:hypothetical protein